MINKIKVHLTEGEDFFSLEELPDLIRNFSNELDDWFYIQEDKLSEDDRVFIEINKLVIFDFLNQCITNFHWFLNCSPLELSLTDYYDLVCFLPEMVELNVEYL